MNRLNQQVDSIVAYWKSRYPGRLPTSNIGKPFNVDMPNFVDDYLRTKDDFYRKFIIRDVIDSTFVEEFSYVFRHVQMEKYKYNPLAYAFLHGEDSADETKKEIESENK